MKSLEGQFCQRLIDGMWYNAVVFAYDGINHTIDIIYDDDNIEMAVPFPSNEIRCVMPNILSCVYAEFILLHG